MAIVIKNTSYNGEVLERLLTKAVTGNELVERGLIYIEPNITKSFSIPRLKTGKMLQKRVEQPSESNSKGDFTYSEVKLKPKEFMAFTVFNPRSFEAIWRPYQPKGELVFKELPAEVQNKLLDALSKQVSFELGDHIINGVYGDGENEFFDGILTRILSNKDVVKVTPAPSVTTILGRLQEFWKKVPSTLRNAQNFRIIMSQEDWDTYDNELTALHHKGAEPSSENVRRFKTAPIEVLNHMPQGVIFGTLCGMDFSTNLWGACNLVDDFNVIQIDKLTNAGEKYFFKMLMSMDTNIAFGEEVILIDFRNVKPIQAISVKPKSIIIPAEGGSAEVEVVATGEYTIGGTYTDFTVEQEGDKLIISAEKNATENDKTGKVELSLTGTSKKALIELFQGNSK